MDIDQLHDTVQTALRHLTGLDDDRAREANAIGFSGADTDFGHQLAERPVLTRGQLRAAWKMLQKYRNTQLAPAGIELPKIADEPELIKELESGNGKVGSTPAAVRVKLLDGVIYLYFPGKPDQSIRDAIKGIQGWRWNPNLDGKPWTVPLCAAFKRVLGMLAGAEVEPGLVEKLDTLGQGEPEASEQPAAPVLVDLEGGSLLVRFVDPNGRPERVKKLRANCTGIKWLAEQPGSPWRVPVRYAAQVIALYPEAVVSPAVREQAEKNEALRETSRAVDADFDVPGLKGTLRPFQKAGVQFLELAGGRAGIFDDMGLGKTIQAIAFMALHPQYRPAVIVTTKSATRNWKREIEKWMDTGDRVVILEGTKTYDLGLTGAAIVILSWSILDAWVERLLEWKPDLLVSDEVQYAKNVKITKSLKNNGKGKGSQRGVAHARLAMQTPHFVPLSGTPMENRPMELFPVLHLIDEQEWDNGFKFGLRYANGHQKPIGRGRMAWDFSGASNLGELHERMKRNVIRRTKDQVLTELPRKQRIQVVVDLNEAGRREYQRLEQELQEHIQRVKQYKSAVGAEELKRIEELKQAAIKAKLPMVIEWIEEYIVDRKLVVFTTHTSTVETLMQRFGEVAVKVDGSVTGAKRDEAMQRFQKDPRVKLFVGNLIAAGEALTLTAASATAHLEFSWVPGKHIQGEDRVYRIGQESDSVFAYYLVGEGTIDETLVDIIINKAQVIGEAMDGDGTFGFEKETSMVNEFVNRFAAAQKD